MGCECVCFNDGGVSSHPKTKYTRNMQNIQKITKYIKENIKKRH